METPGETTTAEPAIERLHPDAQAAADAAAEAAGLSVEDWVSRTILNTVRGGALAGLTFRAGGPEAPPAVSLPNQRAVEKAANAAGLEVEEWLSRAVLESLATDESPPSARSGEIVKPSAGQGLPWQDAGITEPAFSDAGGDTPPPSMPDSETLPPGATENRAGGMSYAESFEAARLTEILNRAPVARPLNTEPPSAGASLVPLVVVPAGSPPSRLRPNITNWVSGAALIALLIVAAWVWVLPALKPPGGKYGARPDLTAEVPPAPPKVAALPKPPPRPAIDPSLPPPTRTAVALPKPAARNWAWYEAAAKLGNTKAQLVLADLYLRGDGVEQSYTRAGALYRRAATEGNEPRAQYALGVLLERGDGVKEDALEALLWYKRAARAGNALAMYRAGLAHAKGGKVPQDLPLAREFLGDAAKAGIADAGYELGLIFEKGIGGKKNISMAFDAYAGAAASGHKKSVTALTRLTPLLSDTDIIRSKVLPKPAAEYLAWYTKASRLGKTPAQLALARIYLRGDGVPRNREKAAALFRRAAVGGRDPQAQHALAVMLERGIGVKKSPRGALRWYRAAARNDYAPALLNLGFIYVKGVSVPQDFKKARDYFERAAASNLAEAQYNLGLLFQHGLGVEKDVPMAFKWFSLAVANQNAAAGKALDQLIPTMTSDQITKAKELLTGGN